MPFYTRVNCPNETCRKSESGLLDLDQENLTKIGMLTAECNLNLTLR